MDQSTAEKILYKIFRSEIFTAEIDKQLLQYLVDNSIKANQIKEADIARDIFGRDEDFDPSDSSIVRTHMYSIRKKLKTYYLTEGSDDEFRINIPKGYNVNFVKNRKSIRSKKPKWKWYYIFIFTTVLLLLISLYFGIKIESHTSSDNVSYVENSPIWNDFLNSKLPTLLVIGDYFVYQRPYKSEESELFIRNVEINSKADFEKYLEENSDLKAKYIYTPLTYLGMEVPYVVSTLTRVFKNHSDKLKIKLASDLTWQDVQKNNIIFVGSEKTLRIMSLYLDKLRYKVQLFPHKIFYMPNHKDTVETYTVESYYRYGFHDDFPIIAKFPTTDKNIVMLMVSFSSFGRTESLKAITSQSFSQKLKEKNFINGEVPPFFEVLFKVHGVERTGFTSDILHFHKIKSKILVEGKE